MLIYHQSSIFNFFVTVISHVCIGPSFLTFPLLKTPCQPISRFPFIYTQSFVTVISYVFLGVLIFPSVDCLILLVIWSLWLLTVCSNKYITCSSILCPISQFPKLPLMYLFFTLPTRVTNAIKHLFYLNYALTFRFIKHDWSVLQNFLFILTGISLHHCSVNNVPGAILYYCTYIFKPVLSLHFSWPYK